MELSAIIFLISLLALSVLLGRRVWQVRTGKVVIEATHEVADWTEISPEAIRNRFIDIFKLSRHYGILLLLKLWIKLSYFLKRCDRFVHKQLTHFLKKSEKAGDPSVFIKSVREHKESITREKE